MFGLVYWGLMPQAGSYPDGDYNYYGYVNVTGGGNQDTRMKPPTYGK